MKTEGNMEDEIMGKSKKAKQMSKQENLNKLESDLRQNYLQLASIKQNMEKNDSQIEDITGHRDFTLLKIEGGFEILTPYYAYEKSPKIIEFMKTQHEKEKTTCL